MIKTSHALAGIFVIAAASQAFGQANPHATHHHLTKPSAVKPMGGMDMEKCMRDMKVSEAKLDTLVSKMNAVQGADRIEATTAVINQMASSQKAMMAMCHAMMSNGMGMMGGPAKSGGKGHEGHH